MTTVTRPIKTTSLIAPVMLRGDLDRASAIEYWAGTHASKVTRLPNLVEYNQCLFSATDHGFWPASNGIGTLIPEDWRLDGCAEIRFRSVAGLASTAMQSREVFEDEQNVFARVLPHHTGPSGGRWFTSGHDVAQHVAVLLRHRRGTPRADFRSFVRDQLASALQVAGARDLRAYSFLPYTPIVGDSPGVAHDNPPQHRYHGAIMFGADSRDAIGQIIHDPIVGRSVTAHARVVSGLHAYAVEQTVPVVRAVTA